MNDSAAQSGGSDRSTSAEGRGYTLTDDLARLCLPREFKDSHRKLAYANAICALFLFVGLAGLKAPQVAAKPSGSHLPEAMPVGFVDSPEPAAQLPQVVARQDLEPTFETSIDAPEVVPVVASADLAELAFVVPVRGTVSIKPEARFMPPPPAVVQAPVAPAAPVEFNPARAMQGGSYPPPKYPGAALRNRQQGTVIVEIYVSPEGAVTLAHVRNSSGYPLLDDAALEVVRKRWRFPEDGHRHYSWGCVFQIK